MNLGEVLWVMLAFFFWFMVIWMFIGVFADTFRRNDLSGIARLAGSCCSSSCRSSVC